MTNSETELSKKLLNAQMMCRQALDISMAQQTVISMLVARLDTLEAVVEGMAIGGRLGERRIEPNPET